MEWNVKLDSKSSAHVSNTGIGVNSGCYCDPGVTVSRGTQVALSVYPAGCSPAQSRGFHGRVISPGVYLLFKYSQLDKRMQQGQSVAIASYCAQDPKWFPKGATEETEEGSSRGKKASN